MAEKQKTIDEIKTEAINLVKNEVNNYKDGLFFITENVAVATRPLIRVLRKTTGEYLINRLIR